VEKEGGILQWFDGATMPRRGYCGPKTLYLFNMVKRLIVGFTKMWPLVFMSKKKLLEIYTDIAWKIVGDKIMKYGYMTAVAQELQDLCYGFLLRMGFEDGLSLRFAKILSCMVEYDEAYRYRVVDLMGETTKWEMVARPRKEIKYLMRLSRERDMPGVAEKFQRIGMFLRIALLVPRVRKSFVETIEESNFEKLQMDDVDFYWTCLREDYKYGGFTNEHRKKIFVDRGWKMPEVVKVDKVDD
jgi:hypothetical protein